jgi:hypothetical protein
MPLLRNCGFAGPFQQKQMEVRGHRLGIEQPQYQGDLTSVVGEMVSQVLHQVRQADLRGANGKLFLQEFVCHPIHEVCLVFLDLRPLSLHCGEVRKRDRIERMSCRVHKSVKKAEPGDASFQYVSQPHSPPRMWTSVSLTERKLPPRSRVNCSLLSAETARKTRWFAQRSYSKSS